MRRALTRYGMSMMLIDFLVKGTKLTLESNVFEWNGRLYQQKFGTAIGTPLAPPYSGLFIGELEREAFAEWATLHPDQSHQLQRYKRLIDDGWGLWTGPLDLLYEFLAFMNSRVASIRSHGGHLPPQLRSGRGAQLQQDP